MLRQFVNPMAVRAYVSCGTKIAKEVPKFLPWALPLSIGGAPPASAAAKCSPAA